MGKSGFRFCWLGIFGSMLIWAGALAGEIQLVVDGREGEVVQVTAGVSADEQGGQAMVCPEGVGLNPVGQPDIPWKLVTILLPPDVRPETVQAELTEAAYVPVTGPVAVRPVAAPVGRDEEGNEVIEWPAGKTLIDGFDTQAWSQDAFCPAEARLVQVGQLRQYHLADIGPAARWP